MPRIKYDEEVKWTMVTRKWNFIVKIENVILALWQRIEKLDF